MDLLEKISNNRKEKNIFEKKYKELVKPFLNDNEYFYFELPTRNNNIELSESELKKLLCIESSESESKSELKKIKELDLSNFIRILLNQYTKIDLDLSNFDSEKAYTILAFYEKLDNSDYDYVYVKCNSELMEFLNIKFLYFKKNHNLKYDKYSVYFDKHIINFDSFKIESYILSIVLNDYINTYLVFEKNSVPLIFKKIIYDLSQMNYLDILNKNSNHISKSESELISKLDYSILGIKDINLNSLNSLNSNNKKESIKDIIFYYESKLNDLDNRFKRLIKIPIKRKNRPFSNFELNSLKTKLKNNRKEYKRILKELDSLYDSLYNYINYESKYESEYFENLLMSKKDSIIDYDNFNYSYKELESLNLIESSESESESSELSESESESSEYYINLVFLLH